MSPETHHEVPHWAAGVILVQQQEASSVQATGGHR